MTQTLKEILGTLQAMDDDMTPEDFEPATIIGDLRGKVDAVKWRIDSWLAEAEMIDTEWIAQLVARKRALVNKAQKLSDYVKHQMIAHNFDTLPGSMVRIDLRLSPVAVKYTTAPTPEDFVTFPGFVAEETTYKWNTQKVKDTLKLGAKLPFAELSQDTHIRFFPKRGNEGL